MATLNKLALKGTLKRLNTLYSDKNDLEAYQQALQKAQRDLHFSFPGLTIILVEDQEMHALAPEPDETEHTLGWHDFYNAQLCLDDGQTSLSDVASLEVKQEDETWLAGTVAAGGPARQSYILTILTASTGETYALKYGDIVRHVVFRDNA